MSHPSITAGALYTACLNPPTPSGGWFSLSDCLWRYTLTVMFLYWSLLTSPVAFTIYIFRHNHTWYRWSGLALSLTLPVYPLGIATTVLFEKIKSCLSGPNWMEAGPGSVFFVKPKNKVTDFIWSCYLVQSMAVGQFLLAGTDETAISHTWADTILTKDFWRAKLEKVGARVPRQVGRWCNGRMVLDYPNVKCDLVVKVPDSYLGIGDSFWNYGKDFNSDQDLQQLLADKYGDKQEVMILELVRPLPGLGVHQLDIITIRTPEGDVKVLNVLLWTGCSTDSSHSCSSGYTVDVDSETVVAPIPWYSVAFGEIDPVLVGTKFPMVRRACEQAVAAHHATDAGWLTAVGWDCMVTKDNEPVFFEGNFAGARTPRRMFLNFGCLKAFVSNYFWPFGGEAASARPASGNQLFRDVLLVAAAFGVVVVAIGTGFGTA